MPDRNPSREPELLTIVEAAELLRAPVATLRYWRHLGTGPRSFRLGRRVLYRRDDLYAWIDHQRTEAATGRRGPTGGAPGQQGVGMGGSARKRAEPDANAWSADLPARRQ